MKKSFKLIIIISVIIGLMLISTISYYFVMISPISTQSQEVSVSVVKGDTYASLGKKLLENNLIKSELCYKIYIKLNPPKSDLKAGEYTLNRNMSLKNIVNILQGGSSYNPNTFRITFKEGINIVSLAQLIDDNTNNSKDDVFSLLKDQEYINKLIEKYWFLDKVIQNSNIYYPLEGYLYPDTYEFKDKDVTVSEIFETMLNNTEKKLEPYKDNILASTYSPHEIITLASIVELEGKNDNDRRNIAGVFYNRLAINMSLGSDVTTYYASQVTMNERDLSQAELDSTNPYNTRNINMGGKLPIGPICNPSINSISAVLNPLNNDYYYFIADKNGTIYFTKTIYEHNQKKQELISEDLWFQY